MLLKNGHLIDPTTKTNEFMDIRIENGIITKIAKDLTSETDEEILDLSGLTIAPGLHRHSCSFPRSRTYL